MALLTDIDTFIDAYKGTTVYWINLNGKATTIESGKVRGFYATSQTDGEVTTIIVTIKTTSGDIAADDIYESIEDVEAAIDAFLANLKTTILATVG